ncbi:unnamed protein product [Fusarium langsethiae]|nr:unnamed protein product [Fusarium langsethiae]
MSIPHTTQPGLEFKSETCFCKIKLFSDHGAERKFSNDITQVTRSICKLERRIAEKESVLGHLGAQRQSVNASRSGHSQLRNWAQENNPKRHWPLVKYTHRGHTASASLVKDYRRQLQSLRDMFISTCPVSTLYLSVEERDDPDSFSVLLADVLYPVARSKDCNGLNLQARSIQSHTAGSISTYLTTPISLTPRACEMGSSGQQQEFKLLRNDATPPKTPTPPQKIRRIESNGGSSEWINVLDVDPWYTPPGKRELQNSTCLYVLCRSRGLSREQNYHRAIYIQEYTSKEMESRIASKWYLDPSKIRRTVYSIHGGFEKDMDDDVVRKLRYGQEMTLEIEGLPQEYAETNRESEMIFDLINITPERIMDRPTDGIVLRLAL